jgi:hypothetical protein
MELRRRQEWEAEEAERQWWESLSEEEREAVRQRRAREQAEATKRADELARQAELEEGAHQVRIKDHEDRHGGHVRLEERQTRLQNQLRDTPRPDPLSAGGTLLVMMFTALLIAGFAAPAVGGFGSSLIVFEAVTIIIWALWMRNRGERRVAHDALEDQIRAMPYRFGCGSATCSKCYFETRARRGLEAAQENLGVDYGCGNALCMACYPKRRLAS